jgi:hypothetical protein
VGNGVIGLRGTDVARGILPLLGYAALTAAMDVYGGNRLQEVGPASLAAISFTLTAFLAIEIRRAVGHRFCAAVAPAPP